MTNGITAWLERLGRLPVLFRSFISYARLNGFAAAVVKSYQFLRWGGGFGYGQGFRRWFSRNRLDNEVAPAPQVFGLPSFLVIGPLDLPQCRKYRVIQKLELLRALGVDCHMSHLDDAVRVYNLMQTATHLMLYRVASSPAVEDYLVEARRLGLKIVYDIDDPIFDVDTYRANRNLETLDPGEREQLLASARRHLEVMRECELITVSTTALAELVRSKLPAETWVWPNGIDGESQQLASLFEGKPPPPEEATVIAYMSGSRAHDRDFESVAPALVSLLAAREHLELLLVGYVQPPACLAPFEGRIERIAFGSYYEYFAAIARAQIVIVPLLVDRFNECKSAIRYFEASLLGRPTVASRVGQFREVISDGVNGFLVEGEAQWRQALTALVDDAELRQRIGDAARAAVESKHTVGAIGEQVAPLLARIGLRDAANG